MIKVIVEYLKESEFSNIPRALQPVLRQSPRIEDTKHLLDFPKLKPDTFSPKMRTHPACLVNVLIHKTLISERKVLCRL